jgi:hypothetical protein
MRNIRPDFKNIRQGDWVMATVVEIFYFTD